MQPDFYVSKLVYIRTSLHFGGREAPMYLYCSEGIMYMKENILLSTQIFCGVNTHDAWNLSMNAAMFSGLV